MAQYLGYAITLVVAAILASLAMIVVSRLQIPRRIAKQVPERGDDKPGLVQMRTLPESSKV